MLAFGIAVLGAPAPGAALDPVPLGSILVGEIHFGDPIEFVDGVDLEFLALEDFESCTISLVVCAFDGSILEQCRPPQEVTFTSADLRSPSPKLALTVPLSSPVFFDRGGLFIGYEIDDLDRCWPDYQVVSDPAQSSWSSDDGEVLQPGLTLEALESIAASVYHVGNTYIRLHGSRRP